MKVFLCLSSIAAALFLYAAEAVVDHNEVGVNERSDIDLGTAIKMFVKSLKHILPCGFPPLLIPVLDPFTLSFFQFHPNNSFLSIGGNVTNLIINGLNNVQILSFNYNPDTNRIAFDISIPVVHVFGQYELFEMSTFPGFPFSLAGVGLLDKKIISLRLVGYLELNDTGHLKVTLIKFNFYFNRIDSTCWNYSWDIQVNNFVNKFTSELALLWSQQIQKHLGVFYTQQLIPAINRKLKNVSMTKLINELITYSIQMEMVDC